MAQAVTPRFRSAPAPARSPEEVRAAIRKAVIGLVGTRGVRGITMLAVAKQADVPVDEITAIYGNRDAVLADAVKHHVTPSFVPDTGSLRGDLVGLTSYLQDTLASPLGVQVIAALLDEAVRNPVVARVVYDNAAKPVRVGMAAVFERAKARGEMRPDIDIDLAIDLLVSPLYMRRLESIRAVDPAAAEQLADLVATAIAAP